jgi:hypothetical protein
MKKIHAGDFIGLIPFAFGLVFAAGMIFLAVNLTENSREHYQTKKQWSKVDFSSITISGKSQAQKPKRERTWSETFKFYEIQILIIALPLIITGLGLMSVTLGTLPERNPLGLTDLARRGFLGMVCLILLSTGIFLIYIWTLRVGLF